MSQEPGAEELRAQRALEERNKEVVATFFREVPLGGNLDAIDELVAEDYVQHNPHAGQGREGVRHFFTHVIPAPITGIASYETNLIADGDFVVRQNIRDDGMLIDIFRVKDGLLQEHWDAHRPAPGRERRTGF